MSSKRNAENEKILESLLPCINFSIAETEEFKLASINKLLKYVNSSRRDVESVKKSLIEATEFLEFIEISPNKLMRIFYIDPNFLGSNFEENLTKYALFGKLVNRKTKCLSRDEILLKNPSAFRFPIPLIYGRLKHLMSDAGQFYMRTPEITLTKVLRAPKEFEEAYRITDKKLTERYPFDLEAKMEIFLWDENKELLEKIRQSNKVVI